MKPIVSGAVIMVGVTLAFLALRVVLKSAAAAALLTGLLGIAFFSFGHIYVGPEDQPDSRHPLGLGIPLVGTLLILQRGRTTVPHKIGVFLNYATPILLVAPLFQLAAAVFTPPDTSDGGLLTTPVTIDDRLNEVKASLEPADTPDVYHIILHGYPRNAPHRLSITARLFELWKIEASTSTRKRAATTFELHPRLHYHLI